MKNQHPRFGIVDAVVFGGSLLVSASIGIYFAFKDREKKNTKSYLFGSKKLSPYAVALSMAVSYISAVTVVVYPLEAYMQGVVFIWLIMFGAPILLLISIKYVPMIRGLQLKTLFELIYMSVAVYLPSLALSSVTPIPLLWSIVLTTVVCTFYTTLGGIKAVIWTDVLQAVVMFTGLISIFIRLIYLAGGFTQVAEAVERGGRNNFLKVGADPRERNSILAYLFGYSIVYFATNCTSQVQWQRYMSCRSAKDAGRALLLSYITVAILLTTAVGIGLAMYAHYEGCDPLKSGKIERSDQVVPFMVVDIFQGFHGMTGLYVSAAYSGTLSTVSSGINSIAAVIVYDYLSIWNPVMTSRTKYITTRVFSAVVGCTVLGLALFVSTHTQTILSFTFILDGCSSGPILGVFLLAACVPPTNSKGALIGLSCGIAMAVWVGVGNLVYGSNPSFQNSLPVGVESCNLTLKFVRNTTASLTGEISTVVARPTTFSKIHLVNLCSPNIADTLYSISPFYIGAIGFWSTITIGIIVSFITGKTNAKDINPEAFIPVLESRLFPSSVRKFFRFGVPERRENILKMNENQKYRGT